MSPHAGRYDNLHGDEPELEAARREREERIADYRSDHGEEHFEQKEQGAEALPEAL